MSNKKILNIETFNCKIHFIITNNIKKDILKVYNKYNVQYDDFDVEGIVIRGDLNIYYLIIDVECLSHNTLAHEIYHTTVRITEDRDVVDEETQAWLCGFITESAYKFIKQKKLEIK